MAYTTQRCICDNRILLALAPCTQSWTEHDYEKHKYFSLLPFIISAKKKNSRMNLFTNFFGIVDFRSQK